MKRRESVSEKSKRCVLFMTFRPSQRTLFMARRNWVPLALSRIVSQSQSFTDSVTNDQPFHQIEREHEKLYDQKP